MVGPPPIGDQRLVGQFRIAHPYPHPAPAFDHGVAVDGRAGRNRVLAGNFDAVSGSVEFKPVIAALDIVANHIAQRKWQMPVAAAVFQRNRIACNVAIKHDRFAQDHASQGDLVAEFIVPGRHVPAIS
jgi:hypothetical protein